MAEAAVVPMQSRNWKLHASRFELCEQRRNIYYAVPEAGTPFEAMLSPEYWAHVAGPRRLRPTDRIEVHAEDGSYFAELYVHAAGPLYAKVSVLRKVEFEAKAQEPQGSNLTTEWRGPHHKWSVMRGKDPVQTGFADKEAALAWLAANAKSLA